MGAAAIFRNGTEIEKCKNKPIRSNKINGFPDLEAVASKLIQHETVRRDTEEQSSTALIFDRGLSGQEHGRIENTKPLYRGFSRSFCKSPGTRRLST
jgi:hypothetical protein